MTSNGVMVIATATPLIIAAVRVISQLFGLNHYRRAENNEPTISATRTDTDSPPTL